MMKNKIKISLYSVITILIILVAVYLFLFHDGINVSKYSLHHLATKQPKCVQKDQDTAFILTIDGGAMRGIIPAYVLAYIEKKTGRPISSLFNVIGGTSTGAIGVFTLSVPNKDGQPKYSAEDLLSFYNDNDPYIFSVPLWYRIKTLNGLLGPKYMSSRKLAICKKYFPHIKMSHLLTNAVVTGYDLDENKTVVFTTWHARENSTHDFYIAPLLNAITSPPILYSPGYITNVSKTKSMRLLDGFVASQDPTLLTYLTLMAHYHAKKYIIISLGTGKFDIVKPTISMDKWGLLKWLSYIMPMMVQAQSQEENLNLQALYKLKKSWKQKIFDLNNVHYLRINVKLPSEIGRHGFIASAQEIKSLNYYGKQAVQQNKKKLDWLIAKLKNRAPVCSNVSKPTSHNFNNSIVQHVY